MDDKTMPEMPAQEPKDAPLRVFLVDDHRMLLEGLASVLGQEKDIEIIGANSDSRQALEQIRQLHPDVLVLDVIMPGMSGLEVCRELRNDPYRPAILMLSVHNEEQIVAQAIGAGASGYLLKDAAAQELARAIRQVARGHFFLGDGISPAAITRVAGVLSDPYNSLSPREREVLRLAAEGKNNIEIGLQIGVGAKTVDTHKRRLMRKLGLETPVDLVKFAIRHGITGV